MPTPSRLQIRLLGPIQIQLDGQAPSGKVYGKMLALLAYLALENQRSHSRAQLADLFWPELPAEAARINLRQTLYHLRRILHDQPAQLLAGRDAVRLAADGAWWLDVRDFLTTPGCTQDQHCSSCADRLNQMEHGAALYRGEFLAGLSLDDAPDFEGWRDGWRASLHRQMLALLERLRSCQERHGALERALQHAQRYLELEPWHEAGHRAVIRLLAAAGRPGEALAQYETCCRLLEQELGIAPDAATRTLVQRIRAELQASAAASPPDTAHGSGRPAAPALATRPFPERRQVTVLHCSLIAGDTADAEEIAERLQRPYQQCAALVRQHGGHLLAAPGASFVAYFGYPSASEDAAHNAVRAAQAIVAACPAGIAARSGIHTAIIVTGHVAEQPDPAGTASALALRLSERAAAGEIHLSDSTRQLVIADYTLQACGSQALRSYRVQGATLPGELPDAAGPLPPMLGREAELAQLLALRDAVVAGHGQCAILRGEAGIGKSRLLRALADTLDGQLWQRRNLQCEPAYRATPWYPLIVLLEGLLGCAAGDSAASKRARLAHYLASRHPALQAEATALLETLLGIANAAPTRAAETLKQETTAVLLALLRSAAERQPMLLVIEDLHWADPSTLALLAAVTQQAAAWPLLTLYTVRNDTPLPPWLAGQGCVLELAHLGADAMTALVAASQSTLSAASIARIVARAEGIPLFAEALAHQAAANPATNSAANPAAASVPVTLGYLLAAQLDATGPARRLAQLAATVGRSFDLELLGYICDVDRAQLRTLQQARLLVQRADQHYEFRHALICDAAYQSQTRADRQSAHRRVADALIQHLPRRASQVPAQVAHHLGAAGDGPAALHWWLTAGQQALASHACAEAAEHLRSGLAVLDGMPASPAQTGMERALLLTLGQALLALAGYGSPEAAAVYDRAYALCNSAPMRGDHTPHDAAAPQPDGADQACSGAMRFDVLWGLWMVSSSRENASFRSSAALVQPLLAAARDSGDVLRLGHANAAAANLALWQGQYAAACTYAETAIALCTGQPRPRAQQHGHDPQVAGLAYASWAYQAQGNTGAAYAASDAAITLARSLEHPDSLCFALVHAATVHRFEHDVPAVATLAQEILALAAQYQLALWQVAGTMLLGWSQAHAGQREGLALLEYSAAAVGSVMPGIQVAFLHPLAEACGFLRDYPAQLKHIEQALAAADRLDEHLHRERLHAMRASCLQQLQSAATCEVQK